MSSDLKPISLVFSYSHRDEDLLDGLREHLGALKRQGQISEWHDRKIIAGTDWEEDIEAHLDSADIILLLMSPSFINSDYCYATEMTRAIQRHESGQARVIPVIVRPSLWQTTPMGKIQALPKDGKPVTSWDNLDEAWLDVAKGIIKSIDDIRSRHATTVISPSIGDNDGPIPDEESVALIFAQTITGKWAEELRKSAWYVNMGTFYRVMLLLKGDKSAQHYQFPPPPDDEMAWFDLYRYSDQASIPDGVEDFERNKIGTDKKVAIRYKPTDPAYVLVSGGYYWFTLHMAAISTLDEACGRRLFVTQK